MIKCLIALLAMAPCAVWAQTVWTWVDERGRRHYSDTEVPGAVQVEVSEGSTFSGNALTSGPPTSPQPRQAASPQTTALPYSTLTVSSPQANETVRNVADGLNVSISISPSLATDHRVDVILDGARRNLNLRGTQLVVPGVVRGEHQIQAAVIDANGSVVQQSAPVRFFVQQTSAILSPAMQGGGAPPANPGNRPVPAPR